MLSTRIGGLRRGRRGLRRERKLGSRRRLLPAEEAAEFGDEAAKTFIVVIGVAFARVVVAMKPDGDFQQARLFRLLSRTIAASGRRGARGGEKQAWTPLRRPKLEIRSWFVPPSFAIAYNSEMRNPELRRAAPAPMGRDAGLFPATRTAIHAPCPGRAAMRMPSRSG